MIKRLIGVGTFEPNRLAFQLVNQVLGSGRISYGPFSREFENAFAGMHGCDYGVLSNSGTSSLQVALQAMKELHGWNDGDEVIVPALTFVATVNVVLHNRLTPVPADIDPDYYDINPALVEARITPRTRAIIPVHTFGQPADMLRIKEIARRYSLKVIEDCCETVLVRSYGEPVGSLGDVGCFSFYVAHILTAGIGGMGITNNEDYAVKMRSLVNHGRNNIYISIDDTHTDRLSEVIGKRFEFESVGHSFRITELEAALGLSQIGTLDSIISRRQENAAYLMVGLAPLDEYLQLPALRTSLRDHAFMMFPIVLKQGHKPEMCQYLEERGIETRDMLPLVGQPVYRDLFNPADYPVARRINENGFYVGCHQGLDRKDLDYIIKTMAAFFRKVEG